jgi:hypothetical protein
VAVSFEHGNEKSDLENAGNFSSGSANVGFPRMAQLPIALGWKCVRVLPDLASTAWLPRINLV